MKCLLSGFSITFLCSIFIFLGVQFILYLLKALHLQKDVVIIFSSIFYGIVYLIARAVVNARSRGKQSNFAPEELDSMDELIESRPQITGFRITAWSIFGIISVMWLTPALVIYWASPVYPSKIVVIFSFILSLPTAVIYYLLNDNKFKRSADSLVFYLGACSGLFLAIFLIKICEAYL